MYMHRASELDSVLLLPINNWLASDQDQVILQEVVVMGVN